VKQGRKPCGKPPKRTKQLLPLLPGRRRPPFLIPPSHHTPCRKGRRGKRGEEENSHLLSRFSLQGGETSSTDKFPGPSLLSAPNREPKKKEKEKKKRKRKGRRSAHIFSLFLRANQRKGLGGGKEKRKGKGGDPHLSTSPCARKRRKKGTNQRGKGNTHEEINPSPPGRKKRKKRRDRARPFKCRTGAPRKKKKKKKKKPADPPPTHCPRGSKTGGKKRGRGKRVRPCYPR